MIIKNNIIIDFVCINIYNKIYVKNIEKGFIMENELFESDFDESVFDIDMNDFEGPDDSEFDFSFETEKKRYINPGKKKTTTKPVKYRNAMNLAKHIGNIQRDDRFFIFLDGNFVFGDFIEAWIIHNNYNVLEMTISTLSLSQNNVDSLVNLINGDYLQKLNIIVSDYFFSHERRYLVPYMYQELDTGNRFQLAVARVHTKVCLMKTECGREIIIHGSANLRTSGNVEQIVIETDDELFKFNEEWHNEIIEKYKTINKCVGGKELWQVDQENINTSTRQEKQEPKQLLQNQDGQQRQQENIRIRSRSKGNGAW